MTAALVLHLGEVDARRLHVDKGFSSLFAYCVEELCFSEDEACRRIEAARLARRIPAIHGLLQTGAISLTVLGLLKPHLTGDDHRELLAGVSRSSVRQAKEWLAARFPVADVPSSIRKLPERRRVSVSIGHPVETALGTGAKVADGAGAKVAAPAPARVTEPALEHRAAPSASLARLPEPVRAVEPACQHPPALPIASPSPLLVRPSRGRIEPLSEDRFLVKLTASRAMRDKLELARDLMLPAGELSVVLERALDLLIADLQKTKQGRTSRPRKKQRPAQDTHVTRAARREVVSRDGWRCSFVAEDGRRCDARGLLEFDHETPKGCGGGSQAENLRLLCRAHNRWAAERVYGKAHVARVIEASRGRAGEPLVPEGARDLDEPPRIFRGAQR